tara:strand:+ start:1679 stop:2158 length:480 start_codon:yes stop_codon:yes gene_type:complete
MNKNKYLGVWFFGLSKSGKTFSSKHLKKKIKNNILVDGDIVRKKISFDLGYKVSDRKIQLERLLGISEISIQSNCFPIVSSVYMTKIISKKIKKNNILLIKVSRNNKQIKNYSIYKNKNNVVGKNIFYEKFKFFEIYNDGTKNFTIKLNNLLRSKKLIK